MSETAEKLREKMDVLKKENKAQLKLIQEVQDEVGCTLGISDEGAVVDVAAQLREYARQRAANDAQEAIDRMQQILDELPFDTSSPATVRGALDDYVEGEIATLDDAPDDRDEEIRRLREQVAEYEKQTQELIAHNVKLLAANRHQSDRLRSSVNGHGRNGHQPQTVVEIDTLYHPLHGQGAINLADDDLADALNEGWEILNISVVSVADMHAPRRVVTLKREVAQEATQPTRTAQAEAAAPSTQDDTPDDNSGDESPAAIPPKEVEDMDTQPEIVVDPAFAQAVQRGASADEIKRIGDTVAMGKAREVYNAAMAANPTRPDRTPLGPMLSEPVMTVSAGVVEVDGHSVLIVDEGNEPARSPMPQFPSDVDPQTITYKEALRDVRLTALHRNWIHERDQATVTRYHNIRREIQEWLD